MSDFLNFLRDRKAIAKKKKEEQDIIAAEKRAKVVKEYIDKHYEKIKQLLIEHIDKHPDEESYVYVTNQNDFNCELLNYVRADIPLYIRGWNDKSSFFLEINLRNL